MFSRRSGSFSPLPSTPSSSTLQSTNMMNNTSPDLLSAVKSNDLTTAKICLANGADINKITGQETPLLAAIDTRLVNMSAWLLRNGANVNLTPPGAVTPLHASAVNGFEGVSLLLLDGGANLSAIDEEHVTPLHAAIRFPKVVELFLERRANIYACDNKGRTPLHIAVEFGVLATVNLLLEHEERINQQYQSLLFIEDSYGATPLAIAVTAKHEALISLLLEKMTDNAMKFNLKLTDNDKKKTSKELMSEFASSVLPFAAYTGSTMIVEELLNYGANLNYKDVEGETVFSRAIITRQESLAGWLLIRGAEVDTVNIRGRTPLLNLGASMSPPIDEKEDFPVRELTSEVLSQYEIMIHLLVAGGADLNREDLLGNTILSYVMNKGCDDIAQFLLSRGAILGSGIPKGSSAERAQKVTDAYAENLSRSYSMRSLNSDDEKRTTTKTNAKEISVIEKQTPLKSSPAVSRYDQVTKSTSQEVVQSNLNREVVVHGTGEDSGDESVLPPPPPDDISVTDVDSPRYTQTPHLVTLREANALSSPNNSSTTEASIYFSSPYPQKQLFLSGSSEGINSIADEVKEQEDSQFPSTPVASPDTSGVYGSVPVGEVESNTVQDIMAEALVNLSSLDSRSFRSSVSSQSQRSPTFRSQSPQSQLSSSPLWSKLRSSIGLDEIRDSSNSAQDDWSSLLNSLSQGSDLFAQTGQTSPRSSDHMAAVEALTLSASANQVRVFAEAELHVKNSELAKVRVEAAESKSRADSEIALLRAQLAESNARANSQVAQAKAETAAALMEITSLKSQNEVTIAKSNADLARAASEIAAMQVEMSTAQSETAMAKALVQTMRAQVAEIRSRAEQMVAQAQAETQEARERYLRAESAMEGSRSEVEAIRAHAEAEINLARAEIATAKAVATEAIARAEVLRRQMVSNPNSSTH